MFIGLSDEHFCLLFRALKAHQRHKRPCACICVFLKGFSGEFRIAFDIQDVIGNLEGETNVARLAAQMYSSLWRDMP